MLKNTYRGWTIYKDSRGIFHAEQFGVKMNTNAYEGIIAMIRQKEKDRAEYWPRGKTHDKD